MKLYLLALGVASPLLSCISCSSTSAATPQGQSDAGSSLTADSGTSPPPDAEAPDASTARTYAERVAEASWQAIPGAPTLSQGKMDDMFMLSTTTGFAVSGQTGDVLKTTDAWKTSKAVLSSTTAFFRSVYFLTPEHGFVGQLGVGLDPSISDPNLMYETKDGGANWKPVTTITGSSAKGICNFTALDANHILAVGRTNGPAHVLSSSDAGANWTSRDLGAQLSMLIDAHMVSATEHIIVGRSADAAATCTALRTTDGGASYTKVFAAAAKDSLCWKIDFPSANVGYIANQQGPKGPPAFAKTTDAGKTWVEMPLPLHASATAGYAALSVTFATDDIGWMTGNRASLPSYRTVDGGQTWQVDAALKGPINRMRVVDANTVFAIGGTVWALEIPKL